MNKKVKIIKYKNDSKRDGDIIEYVPLKIKGISNTNKNSTKKYIPKISRKDSQMPLWFEMWLNSEFRPFKNKTEDNFNQIFNTLERNNIK